MLREKCRLLEKRKRTDSHHFNLSIAIQKGNFQIALPKSSSRKKNKTEKDAQGW